MSALIFLKINFIWANTALIKLYRYANRFISSCVKGMVLAI